MIAGMKEKIKNAALEVFGDKGFYRTGIRDIAAKANCSLPTLYYYFKNKEALFESAVCDAYEEITNQIEEQLPDGMTLLDRFYYMVLQRQMLENQQRIVFQIAIKMQMGVDGCESAKERLGKWEDNRRQSEHSKITAEVNDPVFADVVLRVVDNMLLRSMLYGETIPSDKIRQELSYLLGSRT